MLLKIDNPNQGSLFQFGDSHTGHHPEEELAKFDNRSEKKVENFKNPAIFWHPAGTRGFFFFFFGEFSHCGDKEIQKIWEISFFECKFEEKKNFDEKKNHQTLKTTSLKKRKEKPINISR